MVPGPEYKRDPGSSITKISVFIAGQQLCLDIVPVLWSNPSFIPNIYLGPHLGPGMLLDHIHIYLPESIILCFQETSLPLPRILVLVLIWEAEI